MSEAQLSDLRQAFSEVQALGDERGFAHHAGIHGLPLPMYCQHGNQLFLPWHRAYLYFFELALRDRVSTVSLPWWDWASPAARAQGVPQEYAVEQVDGEGNPLSSVAIPEVARQEGSRLLEGEPPQRTFREPRGPARQSLFPNPLLAVPIEIWALCEPICTKRSKKWDCCKPFSERAVLGDNGCRRER